MRTLSSAIFVFIVAAAAAAAAFFFTTGPVAAEDAPRVISVSGTGEVSARPDQATISLGVVTEAQTARDALRANSQAMQAVFDQMDELGIAEENIRTSNFSIQPIYPPHRQGQTEPRRISGYRVSNMVAVLFEDIDAVGAGLDAVVASGANQLHGISFSISEADPLMHRARILAVVDARIRAETLAGAAGVRLGRVLSISEGGFSGPQPMYAMREMAFDGAPPPIASGQQTLTAHVSMTFEIE